MEDLMVIIDIQEILELNALMQNSLDVAEKLRWQWESIKWMSADNENMEFQAIITCFQKEQIDHLFTELLGKSTT
jgi:hypothetical protein